jgi:hypothetical protein
MNKPMPKSLWRIEHDAVCQYEFFAMTPNPNYAIYFCWGTTMPIEVNVHGYFTEFYANPLKAYEQLKFNLERRLDYICSIIDSLIEGEDTCNVK